MKPVAEESDVMRSKVTWKIVGRGRYAIGIGGRCRTESELREMKTKV